MQEAREFTVVAPPPVGVPWYAAAVEPTVSCMKTLNPCWLAPQEGRLAMV